MHKLPDLPSDFTVGTVAGLRQQWLDLLKNNSVGPGENGSTCGIDGSQVAEVDGAGIQSLIALSHELGVRGLSLSVLQPSGTMVKACRILGTSHLLDAETLRQSVR